MLLLDGRVGADFLLDEIAQLEERNLQDLQTLLELRREDLLLGEGLCLGKASHRTSNKRARKDDQAIFEPNMQRIFGPSAAVFLLSLPSP